MALGFAGNHLLIKSVWEIDCLVLQDVRPFPTMIRPSVLTDELNELKALSESNWSCQSTVYIDIKLLRIRLANSPRNPPGIRKPRK